MRASVPPSALALLLLAAQASAAEPPKPARPGRYQVGPVFLTPRVLIKNVGKDSNVFNTESNQVSDATAVVSPALDAVLRVGSRFELTSTGWVDLAWYKSESDEGGTDGGGAGRGELQLGRFLLFAEGAASSAKQRFSPDLDLRIRRHERMAGTGIKANISSRVSASGSFRKATYRYDSAPVPGGDVHEQLDRDSRVIQGELRYQLTSLTNLLVSAEDVHDTFVSDPSGMPVARSRRYLGGVELAPKAVFTGRVLLGRRVYAEDSAAVPPYSGLAMSIAAVAGLRSEARLLFYVDRDIQYSASPAATPDGLVRNSYVWGRQSGTLEVGLPLSLLARATLAHDRTHYVLPTRAGGVIGQRLDSMWTTSTSLLRRFGSGLRLGINVSYQDRNSNFPGESFSAFRYGLQGEFVP